VKNSSQRKVSLSNWRVLSCKVLAKSRSVLNIFINNLDSKSVITLMAITELGGVAGTLESRIRFCTYVRNWSSVIIPIGFNSMKAKFKYFTSKKSENTT